MLLTDDDISKGFDHLETLAILHAEKDPEEQYEAMTAVLEWLGVDECARQVLLERVGTFVPDYRSEARGWVVLGVMVGMVAAKYGAESE